MIDEKFTEALFNLALQVGIDEAKAVAIVYCNLYDGDMKRVTEELERRCGKQNGSSESL